MCGLTYSYMRSCIYVGLMLEASVTSTAGARGKTPVHSKGLWLGPVLQIIGEVLGPISSSSLTSRGRELHLVCVV